MTKINHARPILKLIDDLKRNRIEPRALKSTGAEREPLVTSQQFKAGPSFEELSVQGSDLEALVHQAASSVLAHVEETGNVKLVNRLIVALPEFMRIKALRVWFDIFGSVEFVGGRAKHQRDGKVMLAEAAVLPFWILPDQE